LVVIGAPEALTVPWDGECFTNKQTGCADPWIGRQPCLLSEGLIMALSHGGVYYTKWTHTENGNSVNRRLHRFEIQAKDGHLYYLEGPALPDEVHTTAGQGKMAKNFAQLLLSDNPQDPTLALSLGSDNWPSRRDLVHVIVGILLLMVLKISIALAAGTF
jgi:hypothetical protein